MPFSRGSWNLLARADDFFTTSATWAPLVALMVKNLPVMQETWVPSWGGKDALEEEMATHFSILAWRIPWTEDTGGLWFIGSQRGAHE